MHDKLGLFAIIEVDHFIYPLRQVCKTVVTLLWFEKDEDTIIFPFELNLQGRNHNFPILGSYCC